MDQKQESWEFWLDAPSCAETICAQRYFTEEEIKIGKTIPDLFERVASAVSAKESLEGDTREAWKEKFFRVMLERKFLPAGRTLANAGTPQSIVANCIVLVPEDSIRSIFNTLSDAVELQKAGSGLGFPFGELRPAGHKTVAMPGQASGPVSFLRVYDQAFGVIKQQNRHGANMCVMDIGHPDILEFLGCKAKEGEISNFNISVGLTSAFMQEAESNSTNPWMCKWNGQEYYPRRVVRDHKFAFQSAEDVAMTAREILEEIALAAWKNGEPGVVFLDTANGQNPLPSLGRLLCTNPCLTGDTIIATPSGPKSILKLMDCDGSVELLVDGKCFWTDERGFYKTGDLPVYQLTTNEGFEIRATGNHRFLDQNGIWKHLNDFIPGDSISISDQRRRIEIDEKNKGFCLNYLLGFAYGDGCFIRGDNTRSRAILYLYKKSAVDHESIKRAVSHCLFHSGLPVNSWQENGSGGRAWILQSKDLLDEAINLGIIDRESNDSEKSIPPAIECQDEQSICGFLRGFFDTDGHFRELDGGGAQIILSQSNFPALQAAQRMLLHLGIFSRILKKRDAGERFVFGKPTNCKASYELVITHIRNLEMFSELIGFWDSVKNEALNGYIDAPKRNSQPEKRYASVARIVSAGIESVYDCTVPGIHRFDANGFVSHNCGEQYVSISVDLHGI
jgi:ribonucleoside-diphosphate reductase alpha chain